MVLSARTDELTIIGGGGRFPHRYDDLPWLPYPELFDSFGYATTVRDLPGPQSCPLIGERTTAPFSFKRLTRHRQVDGLAELLPLLKQLPEEELARREARAAQLGVSHWSLAGTVQQIERYLRGADSALRCQRLPRSVRMGGFDGESAPLEADGESHGSRRARPAATAPPLVVVQNKTRLGSRLGGSQHPVNGLERSATRGGSGGASPPEARRRRENFKA